MNNLDVQVLQSFTRKLAYAAEKMAAPMAMSDVSSFLGAAGNQLGEVGRAALDFGRPPRGAAPSPQPPGPALRDDTPTTIGDLGDAPYGNAGGISQGGIFGSDPAGKPAGDENPLASDTLSSRPAATQSPGDFTAPPSSGVLPGFSVGPESNQIATDVLSQQPERNWWDFLYDNAGSIGAAGAGGLGAMALARLFNSSKDDEEESSWAPWLAGAAGAGLGYGAWNYGPQIQQALAGMLGGGDSAAPPPPPAAK